MLSVAACSGRSLARFDSGAFSRVLMPVYQRLIVGMGQSWAEAWGRSVSGQPGTPATHCVRWFVRSPTFSNASNSALGRGRAMMLCSALLHLRQSMSLAARPRSCVPHKCASPGFRI